MGEKPKSIWKKSFTGRTALAVWLAVAVLAIMVGCFIGASVNYDNSNWLVSGALQTAGIFAAGFLVVCLAVIYVLWPLSRWLFFKHWRRMLFGLVCFITLIALFYAEENWRGKHDWEKYKHEWEAKGEKFNFADFVPPPVPDDQNFAMTPIFDATDKLASRKWRNEHRNQHPDAGGNPWDTNLVDPLQIDIGRIDDWPATRSATNGSGDWQTAKASDLKIWQNYYRTLATTTNLFPVAPQPQSPAQDVLLALGKYDSVIEELRAAGARPESRFPLDYDDEDPAEILLPHLAALKRSSQVLQLRAIAELENGQSEQAFEDVKLALRLADSVHAEPFIITHLVRIAILQITLQPIWEGLAEHKWSAAQLAGLDLELSKLDFPADYELSVRGERAAHVKIVDWMEQKRSRFWDLFNMINDDERNLMNNFGLSAEIYLMPRGWYYQSEIMLSQAQQQWDLPMVNDRQQTVSPRAARESVKAIGSLRPSAVNLFARLLLPELGNYAMRTAHGQNSANMARIATALERYRLVNGNYPDSLDALSPQFMEKIPHDIINGGPLHYRRTDDGRFVLYSVGWNETDDGGVVVFKNSSDPRDESKAGIDLDKGDWVWRYPQK